MKKWKIPVSWEMCGVVEIEANTLEEALEMAWADHIKLPDDGSYIDASWRVEDEDLEYVRSCFNDNQNDEGESSQMNRKEKSR